MPLSMPIAPTRIMLPASSFNLVLPGTPVFVLGVYVQGGYWALDAAAQETLIAGFDFPEDWQTFNTFVWTITLGATASNNVRFLNYLPYFADAQTANATVGGATITVPITAGGASNNRVQRSALETGLARPPLGALVHCLVARMGADGADTYAADIGFLGLELVKAS